MAAFNTVAKLTQAMYGAKSQPAALSIFPITRAVATINAKNGTMTIMPSVGEFAPKKAVDHPTFTTS